MESLNNSIENLKTTINILKNEANQFYEKGDNFRGNIREDAANRLSFDLSRLETFKDYIIPALEK
jgi:hypothetical protein